MAVGTEYRLHPTLANDTFRIGELGLCEARLMDDARFPWLILVPMVGSVSEIHQLDQDRQRRLIDESSLCARVLLEVTGADKINIGALGNLVPQLHWHIVARDNHDACWPGPVWGCGTRRRYRDGSASHFIERLFNAGIRSLPG